MIIMFLILKIAILLGTFARTALAHGYVSGIVINNVYTEGWQVSFWYDIVNRVTIPQTPGWYEEALDLGFIPPDQYQYTVLQL
jgi:cellulase